MMQGDSPQIPLEQTEETENHTIYFLLQIRWMRGVDPAVYYWTETNGISSMLSVFQKSTVT